MLLSSRGGAEWTQQITVERTDRHWKMCVWILCLQAQREGVCVLVCVCVSQRSSSLQRAWPVVHHQQSVHPAYLMLIGWLRCPSTSPQPEQFPSSLKTQ